MDKKEKIKVFFTDFWEDYDMYNNIFTKTLKLDFEVEISSDEPDILFYSWLGDNFKYFKCIRIFYTPENLKPKYKECDFSLSFELWKDKRNLRFPIYLLYNMKPETLVKTNLDAEKILASKTGFCSFMITNPNAEKRIDFFNKLCKYKKVDSGGRVLNNIGRSVNDKIEFIKKYKFNIAFENCASNGYTTEKIVEAMYADTIPIYWGNPKIGEEFNAKSFFNFSDYHSEDDLIEDIIEHDKKPEKYIEKFLQPWFIDDIPNQCFDMNQLRKFLYNIVRNRKVFTPIARNYFKKYIYFPLGYQVNMIKGKLFKL
jgi:alpha(1,3/1,4) fucosyltransferase